MLSQDQHGAVLKIENRSNTVSCIKMHRNEPALQKRGGVQRIDLTLKHTTLANPNTSTCTIKTYK